MLPAIPKHPVESWKVPSRTKRMIEKLIAYNEEEPRRFNMMGFGFIVPKELLKLSKQQREDVIVNSWVDDKEESISTERQMADFPPACGTVGCNAGNLLIVGGVIKPNIIRKNLSAETKGNKRNGWDEIAIYSFDELYAAEKATALLFGKNCTEEQKAAAERLFYFENMNGDNHWPSEFEEAYKEARTPKQRVKVNTHRLRYWLMTGE